MLIIFRRFSAARSMVSFHLALFAASFETAASNCSFLCQRVVYRARLYELDGEALHLRKNH